MSDDKRQDADKNLEEIPSYSSMQRGEVPDSDEQPSEVQAGLSPKPRKRIFLGFSVFVTFVIAVVALVLVIIVWSNKWPLMTNTPAPQNQEAFAQLQSTVNQLSQQVDTMNTTLTTEQQSIANSKAAVEKVLSQVSQSQDLWQLEDASHLLQVANYTLSFSHNVKTTVALLETADSRLKNLQDPDVYSIRQAIAKEITSLQAVNQVDVPGIYSQLQALSEQATKLPLVEDRFKQNDDNNYLQEKKAQETGSFAKGMWHALSQVVVIRHHDQPIQPLLSRASHTILMQNMYLEFLQAQWGLLHQQQTVYQASLQQLVSMLNDYFVETSSQVQQVVTSLQALEKINVNPAVPNIGDSLRQVQQLLKNRKQEMLTGIQPQRSMTAKPHQESSR